MADCSKTIEFIQELKRICETYDNGRECHCPISRDCICCDTTNIMQHHIDAVQKWSDEHPAPKGKTYADYLFDILPNIGTIEPGLPVGCRKVMFEGKSADYPCYCIAANQGIGCFECWNEEIPVEKQIRQFFCDTGIVITEEEDKKQ